MPVRSMVAWGSERALLGRFGIVTVVVGLCLLTLGLAGVREPWGGPGALPQPAGARCAPPVRRGRDKRMAATASPAQSMSTGG
jgi:hypothetical protein